MARNPTASVTFVRRRPDAALSRRDPGATAVGLGALTFRKFAERIGGADAILDR